MNSPFEAQIAESLLKIKAVKLSPEQPFTWTSGMKSPIYCDNRQTLSWPEIRKQICDGFCELIRKHYPETDGIAGVATAGIPHGAWVAEQLGLPFIYIRSEAKKHGLNNRIEGDISRAKNWAVIEDLVSTGGSSLSAVDSIRESGANVTCLLAIFSYGLDVANHAFAEGAVSFQSLTSLNALLQKALEIGYIQPSGMEDLKKWQSDPSSWSQARITS